MPTPAVRRPIEADHRHVLFDNHRWERFVPRPGDIVVCTPAKCGTTWMQTIITELLFPDGPPGPVMEIAPWIDARFNPIDEMYGRIEAQQHRRQVKTHTPANGIPWYPEVSYVAVYRDGRDAFMSFLNHMRNIRQDVLMDLAVSAPEAGITLDEGGLPPLDDVHAFFDWWLESPAFFGHLASFWQHRSEPNVLLAHYDDLQADLQGQMRRVAQFLAIEIDPRRWPHLVERCTFAAMKARAAEIGDFDSHFVGGAETFLYKGTNGRWRDELTDEEVARFERRQRELLPPEAVAWLTSTPEARAATPA